MNTYKHLFWISQACRKNNIFLELEYGSFEIHFSLCTATENDTRNTGQTFMKRYVWYKQGNSIGILRNSLGKFVFDLGKKCTRSI